jgi:hypothetical protein
MLMDARFFRMACLSLLADDMADAAAAEVAGAGGIGGATASAAAAAAATEEMGSGGERKGW